MEKQPTLTLETVLLLKNMVRTRMDSLEDETSPNEEEEKFLELLDRAYEELLTIREYLTSN